MLTNRLATVVFLSFAALACSDSDAEGPTPFDPDEAPSTEVDRFSPEAGNLMIRDASNGLPASDAAIDFDEAPFITRGLGPDGSPVSYYNFDVQPATPAPIFAFFRADGSPVDGQLNVVDTIPGDPGYSDFWRVTKVIVPDDYVANQVASRSAIDDAGYELEETTTLVNCPVVPAGSTASLGGGASGLHRGWYDGKVVSYFTFDEAALMTSDDEVPLSPIYVAFNVNPDEDGGGPGSGFAVEDGTVQTHNVVGTLPDDAAYSPLWSVNVFDNTDFDVVADLASAEAASILATEVATVNCPIVD